MSLMLQVFGHKPKYWTNWNFDLEMKQMKLDEKLKEITKVITIYPEGSMNGCTQFHGSWVETNSTSMAKNTYWIC